MNLWLIPTVIFMGFLRQDCVFTVYGPFGRPDMAYFKFANKIMKDEPITIYNHGDMYRDFYLCR